MNILRDIKTIITIMIALVMTASAAYAQTFFGTDTMITCQTYLHTKDTDPEIAGAYDLWALGYVSGLNVSNYHTKKVDLLNTHSRSDVLIYIKAFCLGDKSASKKSLKEAVDKYWDTVSNPNQGDAE